jgi:hypothetical protein
MHGARYFSVARATRATERETASRAYTLAAAQVN